MKNPLPYFLLIPAFPAVYFWGYLEGLHHAQERYEILPERAQAVHAVWVPEQQVPAPLSFEF